MTTQRLEGRVALITGASRGLGAAIARAYAAEGAHVILVAKSTAALEEIDDQIRQAGHPAATLVPFDLANHNAIDEMGLSLFQRFGRLDILVGNAAVLNALSPASHVELKEWDRVMSVNLTANWRLIRSFDGLLRQSDAGRAIFVTCGVARNKTPYWGAYAASKAGLEALVLGWASEIERITKIKANLVDPGPMRTRMRKAAFPGEDPLTRRPPEDSVAPFVELALPDCTRHGEIVTVE
jgi:NAD(P)-dependent dehydrogenase (short-subunit alcohol dehydrogenase family)